MDQKFSVLVQVALHGAYVRLVVAGCVTAANQHALHPLVARARTLIPPVAVTVDLTGAEHVEAGAVDLQRWAVEHDGTAEGAGPVEVRSAAELPADQPAHRPVTALAGRRRSGGGPLKLLPRPA